MYSFCSFRAVECWESKEITVMNVKTHRCKPSTFEKSLINFWFNSLFLYRFFPRCCYFSFSIARKIAKEPNSRSSIKLKHDRIGKICFLHKWFERVLTGSFLLPLSFLIPHELFFNLFRSQFLDFVFINVPFSVGLVVLTAFVVSENRSKSFQHKLFANSIMTLCA